jgi:hypothetical protein
MSQADREAGGLMAAVTDGRDGQNHLLNEAPQTRDVRKAIWAMER